MSVVYGKSNGAPIPISREGGAGCRPLCWSDQLESGRTTGMVITTERVVVSPWRTCSCVKPLGFSSRQVPTIPSFFMHLHLSDGIRTSICGNVRGTLSVNIAHIWYDIPAADNLQQRSQLTSKSFRGGVGQKLGDIWQLEEWRWRRLPSAIPEIREVLEAQRLC